VPALATSSRNREYNLASPHCLPQRLKLRDLHIQLQQGFAAGEMALTSSLANRALLIATRSIATRPMASAPIARAPTAMGIVAVAAFAASAAGVLPGAAITFT
jgi:hypothetical protein